VNTALGVNLKLVLVPSATFQQKMATLQAGNDLPDMMLAGFGNVPQQANFVQAKCQDLSEYLSGDNIKKYPNLANIPRYAWQGMGRIGGRIYGVPVIRPRSGNILMANQTLLKAVGGLSGWDSDQFAKEMGGVTGAHRWGLGASGTNQWGGNYHYASWSLPNSWKVDGGKFSHLLAEARFKDALDFQRSLFKAGSFYPDSVTASTVDLKTLFYNQTIVTDVDGFVAYHTAIPAVRNKFVVDFGRPYKVDGKTSMWFGNGYFGYTVLKKASKARIEMLLRILDYMAAPFGSKEYELTHFGVEGQHFTRGSDGQIAPTALADKENPDTLPIRYICEAPPVSFYPGAPDAARRQHQYDQDTIPLGVGNPGNGLHSDTYERSQAKLIQIQNDGITAIITGRQPVSSWDGVLKTWKAAGGDASATEFAKEYSAQNG
jgi:putative aldouronate transport system substrate-binding protein